jgi:hypothetical protein
VVAPTRLLNQAHLAIGQTIAARLGSRPITLRIVGEVFDQTNDDLLLRGDWSPLTASGAQLQPDQCEVRHRLRQASKIGLAELSERPG